MKTVENQADKLSRAKTLGFKTGSFTRLSYRKALCESEQMLDHATSYEGAISEWPSFVKETYSSLYDEDDCEAIDSAGEFAIKVQNTLESQGCWRELQMASSMHRGIASESTLKLTQAVAQAMGIDKMSQDSDASQDPSDVQKLLDGDFDLDDETRQELERQQIKSSARRKAAMANLTQAVRSGQLGKALTSVTQQAKEQAEAVKALRGFGLGGDSSSDPDGDMPMDLIKNLSGNTEFLDMLNLMGRMKEAHSKAESSKAKAASGEIVGITTGSQIDRLIGFEMAMLSSGFRRDTIRRITESQAQIWECEHEDKKSKGDLVILLDKSSSMTYDGLDNFSKALALASLTIANSQKRTVCLCVFSGDVSSVVVRPGDSKSLQDAIRMCLVRPYGGTDIIKAFNHASEKSAYMKDADVFLITDAVFQTPPRKITRGACGKNGRLFVLGLGDGAHLSMPDADKVWLIPNPDISNATDMLQSLS